MQNKLFLNGFHLKLIGMLSMFIDHFCVYIIPETSSVYLPLRCIGRISFPIFCFLLCEGMDHSSNKLKYLLRILCLSIFMDIMTLILFKQYLGCPLTILFLGGLTIYFLKKPKYFKLLGIIPFCIGILTGCEFFPIRAQYGLYGIILILIFYFSRIFSQKIIFLISKNYYEYNNYIHNYYHYLHFALLISLYTCYTLLTVFFQNQIQYIFTQNDVVFTIQSYSIISCIFLFFYNGKRGYNKTWFKYGCYLFFPLHFVLIYLLSLIIHF